MNALELQITFDQEFEQLMATFVLVAKFFTMRNEQKAFMARQQELTIIENESRDSKLLLLDRLNSQATRYSDTALRRDMVMRLQEANKQGIYAFNTGMNVKHYDRRFSGTKEYFTSGKLNVETGRAFKLEGMTLNERNIIKIHDRVMAKMKWLSEHPDTYATMKKTKVKEAMNELYSPNTSEAVMKRLERLYNKLDEAIQVDEVALRNIGKDIHQIEGHLQKVGNEMAEINKGIERLTATAARNRRQATMIMLRNFARGLN